MENKNRQFKDSLTCENERSCSKAFLFLLAKNRI